MYQNILLAVLLDLPPAPSDDVDYMDGLGRGEFGTHEMQFDTARRAITNTMPFVASRLSLGTHANLSVVLCGRDENGAPCIVSWSTESGLQEHPTPLGQALVFPPHGLTCEQKEALLAAIACAETAHDTQLERAERAVSYCASVVPLAVSQAFQCARLSENFRIHDIAVRQWPISSSACPSTDSCTSGTP
jgi:hypothetical protein